MEDLESKMGAVLQNPELMQKIMTLAQSMNQPQQEEKPPVQQEGSGFPDIDLATLQKITGFAKRSSIDSNQAALLKALRPYLTQERITKLEKAMRTAKLAGLASNLLGNGGLSSILGR